ncbi:protein XNDC1N-like [Ranitomeya variabilis]|uniref:protein XNDC1N-like n=1 Tax=Ranitomeya variabilis TaxID=490064 RepID=UPI0040563A29
MAPVTIRHIVSFSSQDPKHPVENLLIDNLTQPWLSCPRDRSRQLRVELQLDRACHIGYIDKGYSGSAFLQIDVGRSIWALDKGFTTLLPTTTLMPPADARLMKNHRGVRMFKGALGVTVVQQHVKVCAPLVKITVIVNSAGQKRRWKLQM